MTGNEGGPGQVPLSPPSQLAAERARHQLGAGSKELEAAPSRFGRPGLLARAALLRATRHLAVRQSLVDEQLVSGLEAVALDTSLSHRAVSSFPEPLAPEAVVSASTEVGEMFLHASDQVMTPTIRAHGAWEAEETAFLRRSVTPGATFVDVGANVGYFSVLAATLVGPGGRVVAVEPEPRNVAVLKANLWRNRCANAVVLPIAAHREDGFLPLRFNDENRGDHQVGWEEGAALLVPCGRLDHVLARMPVDVVKVDTQGVDHDVIAGMEGLIATSPRVAVMCEFWLEGMELRGVDPEAVIAGYERLGFAIGLLGEGGEVRAATAGDAIAAAEAWEGRYVNLVLRRS